MKKKNKIVVEGATLVVNGETILSPAQSFAVVCTSVGNPDLKQDPEKPISPKKVYPCATLMEAAELCRGYIHEYDLGGGNWTGGQVWHPTTGHILNISYNGRIWDFEGNEVPAHLTGLTYDLFAEAFSSREKLEPANKFVIARHPEGIALNEYEYVLEENEEDISFFASKLDAMLFLNGQSQCKQSEQAWNEEGIYFLEFDFKTGKPVIE